MSVRANVLEIVYSVTVAISFSKKNDDAFSVIAVE